MGRRKGSKDLKPRKRRSIPYSTPKQSRRSDKGNPRLSIDKKEVVKVREKAKCALCGKGIKKSTLSTSGIQLVYTPFTGQSDFSLLCKECCKGADGAITLAKLFPGDLIQAVTRLVAFLSRDVVSLFKFYRLLEHICTGLDLESDLDFSIGDTKYKAWEQTHITTKGKPDFLFPERSGIFKEEEEAPYDEEGSAESNFDI